MSHRQVHLIGAVSIALAMAVSSLTSAHTGGTTGLATITIDRQSIRYALQLPVATIPSPIGERMGLAQSGVAPDAAPLLNLISRQIKFANVGEPCEPAPGFVLPPPDPTTLSLVIDYACAQPVSELTLRDDLFDAFGNDYHALARIEWAGGVEQFAFQADTRETRVRVGTQKQSSEAAKSFFVLGIEHILTGYDHLLFLLALVLRGGNFWSLLKIITAFTVAHSITLTLAALNLVVLPERLVEATIALSIAYVAAENLFMRHAVSRRWAVAFVFGLMHGFGFSNVLRELGLPRQGLVWSLLDFNLGVEVGQAIAVSSAVPALLWLRRFRWEPRAVAAISVLVMMVGIILFVDRAFVTTAIAVSSSVFPLAEACERNPCRF